MCETLTSTAEIVRCEIIGRFVVEIIDKPTVAQRAESDESDAELFACVNQTAGLVHCFEGRVFGLHGVDFGDF